MIDLYQWQIEVAKAIRQLSQEVHALNPGVRYDFNLSTILAPLEGESEAVRLTEHDERSGEDEA